MNEIPRRNIVEFNTRAEMSIKMAMHEVESLGADEKLTQAVVKLQEAFDLVADFTDEQT